MKTLLLSTIAAAAIALSTGTALANNSTDNGFAVYLQSQHQAPAQRSFPAAPQLEIRNADR
jgi:hypothetical protein